MEENFCMQNNSLLGKLKKFYYSIVKVVTLSAHILNDTMASRYFLILVVLICQP